MLKKFYDPIEGLQQASVDFDVFKSQKNYNHKKVETVLTDYFKIPSFQQDEKNSKATSKTPNGTDDPKFSKTWEVLERSF